MEQVIRHTWAQPIGENAAFPGPTIAMPSNSAPQNP